MKQSKSILNPGTKFGLLTVINYSYTKNEGKRGSRRIYLCRCECGKEKEIVGCYLTTGNTRSCGHLQTIGIRKAIQAKQKIFIKKKQTPEQILRNEKFAVYKAGAKRRNLDFKLTKEEFYKLIFNNCFYCNSIPNNIHKFHRGKHTLKYNGIDRKHNNIGYIIENCVTCCTICNTAKSNLSFYDWFVYLNNLVAYRRSLNEKETT